MKLREKARIKHSRLGSRPTSVRTVTKGKPGAISEVARKGLDVCNDQGKTQRKEGNGCARSRKANMNVAKVALPLP